MIAPQHADLSLPLPEKPYRGIDSFRLVDHPIFCARERDVQKLFRAITIYRGVLLYGASGVGKSSLVNAGLLPEAIADGLSPERIRVQPQQDQEIIVERIPLTAAGEPPYLSSLFVPTEDGNARVVLSAKELLARLRKIDEGIYPLLIFDQFEEFVTQFEEAPQARGRAEVAAAQGALLGVLTELLRDHSFRVKLLFSFREDYLAKLNKLFAKYPTLTDQYLRLVPPDKSALPAIIRGPFTDERLRQHFGKELPEEVTAELVREVGEHRQGGLVNLSEVEIASLRLWESPDPAELLKRRGIQGLLEDYLTESLQRLGNLQDPAVALLSRMVTGRGTRNVVLEDDLLQRVGHEEGISEERLRQALEGLETKTGLVRKERRNESYFYEIVSEFLVPWIREQKQEREQRLKLRRWLLRAAAGTALALLLLGGALVWRNSQNVVIQAERARVREAQKYAATAQGEAVKARVQAAASKSELMDEKIRSTKLEYRSAVLQVEKARLQAQWDGDRRYLLSRLAKAESSEQSLEKLVATCTDNFRVSELEKSKLNSEVRSCQGKVSNCQEEKQRAEAAANQNNQKLSECEARAKERCPESYNLPSEVAPTFDKLLYDLEELKEELTVLQRSNNAMETDGALRDAIEQQREAEERVRRLRQLLGLNARRGSP